jgi:hypothetical protein
LRPPDHFLPSGAEAVYDKSGHSLSVNARNLPAPKRGIRNQPDVRREGKRQ